VILYFMSVFWTRTLLFFVILVTLLLGNEFLHQRLENPKLLATLYSFCLFSNLAFLLPTIFANVSTGIFLLASRSDTVVENRNPMQSRDRGALPVGEAFG